MENHQGMNRIRKTKDPLKWMDLLGGTAIVAFIAMSLYCTKYITYQADDFSYMTANQSIQMQNPTLSYLHVELASAWNLYKSWQGTWLSNVLIYLLYGLQIYGIEAFRLACFIIDFLLFASIIYTVWEFTGFFQTQKRYRCWISLTAVLIWGGMNTVSPAEELYWIDVVFAYTVPFICGFLGIGQYLHYTRSKKKSALFLSMAFGFLGCGGPLVGTAFFCAVYLAVYLLQWLEERKLWEVYGAPFFAALAGALLNALSPGNFVRHTAETGDEYNILKVLWLTMEEVVLRYKGLISSGFLLGLCAIVFAFVYTRKEKLFQTKWNPIFLWCYVFFTAYIMIFPFMLAYQLEGYLSDRVGYEVDMSTGMLTILCTLYTAEWAKKHFRNKACDCKLRERRQNVLRLCGIFILIMNLFLNRWSESMIPNQISEVITGHCAVFCDEVNAIYEEIASSEKKDVVITTELPTSKIMKMLDVRDWKDYWGNNCIATWYGQNSIVFEKADTVYTDKLVGKWSK